MPGSSRDSTPFTITFAGVRRAMILPRPGLEAHLRMFPRRLPGNPMPSTNDRGRPSAVLILVYPLGGELHLALTRRTDTVQNHKGQISLPGGAREGQETATENALREANEELGIGLDGVEVLGALTPVYVGASDYLITPIVALAPLRPTFSPDPIEVTEVIEAPLASLLDPLARQEEEREIRGYNALVPFYAIGRHKVWGATAMILAEFAALLESALVEQKQPQKDAAEHR
jgi:8-oxo-dGTP pyrophosphatase MutT (NUDIX family)